MPERTVPLRGARPCQCTAVPDSATTGHDDLLDLYITRAAAGLHIRTGAPLTAAERASLHKDESPYSIRKMVLKDYDGGATPSDIVASRGLSLTVIIQILRKYRKKGRRG